ncbi:MAG: PAS domain-containing protein [Leptospira sp.]|nr:PAS domain-containing protein [Leptospira sp.]
MGSEISNESLHLLHQYKNAIDQSTIVSKTDIHGKITFANDEFCRLSKYNKDELVGSPHNIVRHPGMPKSAFEDLWFTIKSGRIWKGIVDNRAKDAQTYTVRATILPIINTDGNIQEYIGIRTDITELVSMQKRMDGMLSASQKFVPDEFLKFLGNTDLTDIKVGNQCEMDLTILFADIRDFTRTTEKLSSRDTFFQLNEYLSFMEPVIKANGGFIDKFIGDAIMGLFHSPDNAINAGIQMFSELKKLNEKRSAIGMTVIKIGCAIHSGSVIMGTVGTEFRMNTTVIGDPVNTAARLEKLTKKLH